MDPVAMAAAAAGGLLIGAFVAWLVRGSHLARARGVAEIRQRETEAVLQEVRMELASAADDRDAARAEVVAGRKEQDQVEADRAREQEAAAEQLAAHEAAMTRLNAAADQLKEQLAQRDRELAVQQEVGRDLESRLEESLAELTRQREQLEETQRSLVRVSRDRDQLAGYLAEVEGGEVAPPPKRRWKINTFFNS